MPKVESWNSLQSVDLSWRTRKGLEQMNITPEGSLRVPKGQSIIVPADSTLNLGRGLSQIKVRGMSNKFTILAAEDRDEPGVGDVRITDFDQLIFTNPNAQGYITMDIAEGALKVQKPASWNALYGGNIIEYSLDDEHYALHFPSKTGTIALAEDIKEVPTYYKHTVQVHFGDNSQITFTAYSKKNTVIDSAQDLISLFGNTEFECSGVVVNGTTAGIAYKVIIGTALSGCSVSWQEFSQTPFRRNIEFSSLGPSGFTSVDDSVTTL